MSERPCPRLPTIRSLVVSAIVAAVVGAGGGTVGSVAEAAADVSVAKVATCYGSGCDFQPPKQSGCFDDDRGITWDNNAAGDRMITLKYSPTCHAFWAYSPNDPSYGTATIELDIEEKNARGVWVVTQRLFAEQNAGEGADWTNAYGARGKAVRFRAIIKKPDGRVFQTLTVPGGPQG